MHACHIRVHTYRAGTNCDVLVLTKLDLDNALQYYPHIADHIQEVANNRANLVMKRSQISKMAAAEGTFKISLKANIPIPKWVCSDIELCECS